LATAATVRTPLAAVAQSLRKGLKRAETCIPDLLAVMIARLEFQRRGLAKSGDLAAPGRDRGAIRAKPRPCRDSAAFCLWSVLKRISNMGIRKSDTAVVLIDPRNDEAA
jgi:hypothetical protein